MSAFHQAIFLDESEADGLVPIRWDNANLNSLTVKALRKAGVPEPDPTKPPPAYKVWFDEQDGGVLLDIESVE